MNLRPKKLDRYIFSKFITTFVMSLLLIIVLVIVIDLQEKLDKFVDHEAPVKAIIFDYYLNFIPYFINMYSPMFVFIAVIIFTSRLAANYEIIAMLSGGISYRRLLRPYLVAAGLIASVSLYLNLFVIPGTNVKRLEFENKYVENKVVTVRDVHYQISPGDFVYVESFSYWNNTAYKFTLETIKDNRIVSKISSDTAVWDTLNGCWHLNNYFQRTYSEGMADHVVMGASKDTVLALTVDDFTRNSASVSKLRYDDLKALIRAQKMRGDSNIIYAQIEDHTRFAMPFSAIILTIIGVTISSRKKRGGMGWNLAMGIAITFSYILFQRFSQMFVFTGLMPPFIAIWIPNLMYATVAVYLYKVAQK